jgi:nucleoside-diphosphate-sugar epimerase
MKIHVSGATGFIGSAFMRYLATQDVEAVALTRADCLAALENAPVADRNALIKKLSSADAIVHLAGRAHVLRDDKTAAPRLFHESNVLLTEALARVAIAANVKRFVFVSSIGVCGDKTVGNAFTEASQAKPASEYAESKLQAEMRLRETLGPSSTEWTIIRPPMVYGAKAPGNFQRLLGLVYSGMPLPFGSCTNARSMIAVANLTSLLHLCATHPKAKNELFLVSDITVSTRELVQKIARGMGKKALLLPISDRLLQATLGLLKKSKAYTQLFGSLEIDNTKAVNLLNWHPDNQDYLLQAGAEFNATKKQDAKP